MNCLQNSSSNAPPGNKDKAKDWQLEILMEKLRSKASQYKSLQEISKNVRMALLEKRYALDSVEKSQHQKCLDTLQHSIKVTSLQSMIERLESLTRQLGLKFVIESSGVFISSDMFYLEIVLDPTGAVKDVKIHHEGKSEQQSCMELVNCLSKGDFDDFTTQLEGFTSIYQLNAEKKIKCKAFTALESLEADLSTLAQLQMFMKEPFNLIHKSPVGILEKRKGGHPMKLTYFVSPYDLLNVERTDIDPFNIDSVIAKSLGYSVTVCMEGATAHKLQTTTLITVNRNINGKNTPSYSQITPQNSAVIPACFLLKLKSAMPMCISLVRQIQEIHPWSEIDSLTPQPLLNMVVNHSSTGKLSSSNNKGLFVTLPDQTHCYFMTENRNMNAVMVNSIPFTHPAHVPSILKILREQALFNTILSSCVRPNSRQDFENMTMFEVSALSSTQISVSLEHPMDESMATAEIDLSDISNLTCRIHEPGSPPPSNAPDTVSELATKILNKSFSIPITLRAVVKYWGRQAMHTNTRLGGGLESFGMASLGGPPGLSGSRRGPSGPTDYSSGLGQVKQEPGSQGGQTHQGVWNDTLLGQNFPVFPPSDTVRQQLHSAAKPRSSASRKVGHDSEEMAADSSSNDSTSKSAPASPRESIGSHTEGSVLGFQSDLELSGLDPSELLESTDKSQSEFENIDELGDVDDLLERKDTSPGTANLLADLGAKSIGPPNVSITPIPPTSPSFDKRASIDIIPIPQPSSSLISSSITITPIAPSQKNLDEKKYKKSSKSSKDDKSRLEKKRKRKRDESPMGPPEKLPPKTDALNKPVFVSIKPSESPPSTPTSPSMMRKFTTSPTHGKLSPNLPKSGLKTNPSPKHSPAHISSSPKHQMSSPKPHGASPKHPSASGSGKPSMSTLKSAASSPSSKSNDKSSKDLSREKDKNRGLFSVSNSSKKSSTLKVKPLELNVNEVVQVEGLPSPTALESKNSNQARNRKGCLSAIVDKLKVNAQHCDNATDLSAKKISLPNKDGKSSTKVGELKNSEYMVKPSSDGMKLTINKTKTKENSKISGSSVGKVPSCTGSPKSHTGLKPGVNSGPASKKPQQPQKSNSTIVNSSSALTVNTKSLSSTVGSSGSNKLPSSSSSNKISSSSSSISKSLSKSGSPKLSSSMTDLTKSNKDRMKPSKSASEKSIFSSMKERGKSSPTQSTDTTDSIFKLQNKMDPYSSSLVMEGMMKTLDKNFQIPKLSARVSNEDKKPKNDINHINKSTVDTKVFDMITKNDLQVSKYPIAIPAMNSLDQKIRNNMSMNLMGSSPKIKEEEEDKNKNVPQNLSNSQGPPN